MREDLIVNDRERPWVGRHNAAVRSPEGFERPIVEMCDALDRYATLHRRRYGSGIMEDYFTGEEWATILRSVRTLLNCDIGRLDGGTVDGYLCALAEREGVTL